MPKLKGREKRVLDGERNPRRSIVIRIGTGNQYCRNCRYYCAAQNICGIFLENLKINHRFGAERCQKCRDAERDIYELKQAAHREGEEAALRQPNSFMIGKPTLFNSAI